MLSFDPREKKGQRSKIRVVRKSGWSTLPIERRLVSAIFGAPSLSLLYNTPSEIIVINAVPKETECIQII